MAHPNDGSEDERQIREAQAWLVADQYEYGEWGKCESQDPTADPRTLESSRIKPMLFVSSQAALALCATDYRESRPTELFFSWLDRLRNRETGDWTSAGGTQIPMGAHRGWTEITNIRHTAKALDMLLLSERFIPGDAATLHHTLAQQDQTGFFPQHPTGAADLWSTAYAINLLVRASSPDNIQKSIPHFTLKEDWAMTLRNRLDRARNWMCDQLVNSAWHVASRDPVWVTEAVLAEIGADLSIHRPDVCNRVAKSLLGAKQECEGRRHWALLLVKQALAPELQRQVIQGLEGWSHLMATPSTYDMACSVRAYCLKSDPELASFYVRLTNGHESLLQRWSPWNRDEYLRWCVKRAIDGMLSIPTDRIALPNDKAESWSFVIFLLREFSDQVEKHGMWKLLCDEHASLRSEVDIQTAFWSVASPLAKGKGVLIREPETGRGPVDFCFSNGSSAKVLLEFKRAGSSDAVRGLEKQLTTYMNAENSDSAILVLVGNDESHKAIYSKLEVKAAAFRSTHPDRLIYTVYIDASAKASASTVK